MQDILKSIAPVVDQAQQLVTAALQGLLTTAFTDELTNLFNGAALERLADARDRSPPFGVIFMDLSGFKGINDTHGHEAGNAALREAGNVVFRVAFGASPGTPMANMPQNPKLIPFRKSGDEFVVIADGADEARECARKLAEEFGKGLGVPYVAKGVTTRLTVRGAVGLCIRNNNSDTMKDLLDRADAACRVSKFEQSTTPVEWSTALSNNEVDSRRKVCLGCRTTTTILFQKSRLKDGALSRCANCGDALA